MHMVSVMALMAPSTVVRGAVIAAMKKTPSLSSRAVNLKELVEVILEKIDKTGSQERESFDKFSHELVNYFQGIIRAETSGCKANSSKRQNLWSLFHNIRMKGTSSSIWMKFTTDLQLKINDPLLEQSLIQEVFEVCLVEYFSCTSVSKVPVNDHGVVNVTGNELNVVRYVGGYVARSLLKKYERKKRCEVHSQFIDCLGELAVEGERDDVLTYTRKWFDLVNRGGLYPINDAAFTLFVNIETCVRDLLPKHILRSTSEQDSFKASVHDKVMKNEDISFYWALLSQDIDAPEDAESLLGEIITLWVTIRGFSMVASWMEAYKSSERKNTQKSTGLRKTLSGTS